MTSVAERKDIEALLYQHRAVTQTGVGMPRFPGAGENQHRRPMSGLSGRRAGHEPSLELDTVGGGESHVLYLNAERRRVVQQLLFCRRPVSSHAVDAYRHHSAKVEQDEERDQRH